MLPCKKIIMQLLHQMKGDDDEDTRSRQLQTPI